MTPLPDLTLPWPIPLPAVALIAEREGCRLRAYRCPAGVWTCGWGGTDGVTPATTWTQAEADQRLCSSLTTRALQVAAACTQHPSPHQLGAMVSLQYNIGAAAFAGSTVLRAHNRGDWQAAARAFTLWDKARVNGVLTALPGLTARRAAEAALYLAPEPDAPHEPMPQAVAVESSIAASPIAKGGAVTVGAGVVTGLAEAAGSLQGLAEPIRQARALLVDTLGVPPSWILPLVLVAAGWLVLRWRLQQRTDGWA